MSGNVMPYSKHLRPTRTKQTEKIPGKEQIVNNAGGYVFAVDRWERLRRFLILGSAKPTYYQSAQELTRENAQCVTDCFEADRFQAVKIIVDISVNGLAPRQNPAIFALALASVHKDMLVRQAAFGAISQVCRTATHLFMFMRYREQLGGGGGRAFKRVIADWYSSKKTDALAYQMIKYRMREGYTHKRVIELSHKGAGEDILRKNLYLWTRGKDFDVNNIPSSLKSFLDVQNSSNLARTRKIIRDAKLPWEALPTEVSRDPKVWKDLAPHIGLTGLIRNLGRMTNIEAITRRDYNFVVERILNEENLRAAKVHPFQLLLAQKTYQSGHGERGKLSWNPVGAVVDALDTAFYMAFKTVEPTNKRYLLALDISGSMGSPILGSSLTCREASCAMALATMNIESTCDLVGFSSSTGRYWGSGTKLIELKISPKDRLDQAARKITGLPFGPTDCSLPMVWALEQKKQYDGIVIYTDNECWCGNIHPSQALVEYRKKMNLKTKLAVVAFTSTGFSIADPEDSGMLDCVGFDASAPAVMSNYFRG